MIREGSGKSIITTIGRFFYFLWKAAVPVVALWLAIVFLTYAAGLPAQGPGPGK
jgi:glycerol-3-phosphate acyltransferase PlsY